MPPAAKRAFFAGLAMRPHGPDLFRSDCPPQRAQLRSRRRNARLGGMNHGQQNPDDDGRIRQRARRQWLCEQALQSS
jgi:hypothetical protein